MTVPKFVIGVDIGGTHITAALVDLEQKQITRSSLKRASVDANGNVADIITAWSDCITAARQNAAIAGVCIAMPGPFDYEAGICLMQGQGKYESLYGLNIKELLASSLHIEPSAIFMDNDAACFLHGEVLGGIANQYVNDTAIGITLGTGLGSAVYRNGNAYNADLWRLPFKDGIAEDYLSTRWFIARFETLTGQKIKGVKELASLTGIDENAQLIFREFGINLGQFLLSFIKMEAPQAVIIGGNIAKAAALFGEIMQATIAEQYPHIKITRSLLGEEAPLLGAVGNWLFHRQQIIHL